MRRILFSALAFAALAAGAASRAAPHDEVTVATSKTSIYVGSVTLSVAPLKRTSGQFVGTYHASVVPWFFYTEDGKLAIDFSQSDLERLAKGETVDFTGRAENTKKKPRTITGRAVPTSATEGRLKVRLGVVSPKVELIFNTTYRFSGTP